MDPRVTEFHSIMPLENVPSVMVYGILAYEQAARLLHRSVAMQAVQDRRDLKQVPGGLKLHQYANLYFHARNPMMYARQDKAESLCVLRISTAVLDLEDTVLSDQNASSNYARFLAPRQWQALDFDDIFALNWMHPGDQIAQWRHKSRKCAEVLVAGRVLPEFLLGAYVASDKTAARLRALGFELAIEINPSLFFR